MRQTVLQRSLIVIIILSAPAWADDRPTTSSASDVVEHTLTKLAAEAPSLYARHAGYVRYLAASGPSHQATLNDVLDSLARGNDLLAKKTGTFTWAVSSANDPAALPITLVFPKNYRSGHPYPLVVRLRPAGTPPACNPNRQSHIVMILADHDATNYLGRGTTHAIDAVRWAVTNVSADPQRVYLDATANYCSAALRLAALRRDLFSAAVLHEPAPYDRVSEALLGLPVLLLYRSPHLRTVPNTIAALSQQLARAGAVVEALAIPAASAGQTDAGPPQRTVEAWMFSHRGAPTARPRRNLDKDPLYGLYDGRPIRIVLPTGGDKTYRSTVKRMARFLAAAGHLAYAAARNGKPQSPASAAAGRIPIIRDIDIADKQVRAHWILLGAPTTNAVLADQLVSAPVRFDDGWIVLPDLDKRYPADSFGFVYARPNALDAGWRVLIIAAARKEFFDTHIGSALMPNADLPLSRRRPDLTILHLHTDAIAGLWFTNGFGRLVPSPDPRRIPAHLETCQHLNRLEATAARLATDSHLAFAATNPENATRPVIDADRLDLAGLLCLIGSQPIVTAQLSPEQLEIAVAQARQAPNVSVLPSTPTTRTKPDRTYRVAIPMQHLEAVSREISSIQPAPGVRIATQTLRNGLIKLFGRPGDLNRDDKIDLDDLVFFKRCFTGPTRRVTLGCRLADLDGDEAVDTNDFQTLQQNLTEPEAAMANSPITAEDLEDWISNLEP